MNLPANKSLIPGSIVMISAKSGSPVERQKVPLRQPVNAPQNESPCFPLRGELRHDGQLALNWPRVNPRAGAAWHIHWVHTDLTPDRLGAWTLLVTVVDGARREVLHDVNGLDTAKVSGPRSPDICSQFIEHLGRCICGGIWAEMLEDRKCYFPMFRLDVE